MGIMRRGGCGAGVAEEASQDVGEKIGDVVWDRCRIELRGQSYPETKAAFLPIIAQPNLQRACLDATGNGDQLGQETRAATALNAASLGTSLQPQINRALDPNGSDAGHTHTLGGQ